MSARTTLGLVGLLWFGGCTFEDGQGWATVTVTVAGSLPVADGGEVHTDLGFEVALTSAQAELDRVELLDGSASAVALDAGQALDLLAGGPVTLPAVEVGEVAVVAVRVVLHELTLAGSVTLDSQPVPVQLDVDHGLVVQASGGVAIGPGGAEAVRFELAVSPGADLFDGIHFDELDRFGGVIRLAEGQNELAYERVADRLRGAALEVVVYADGQLAEAPAAEAPIEEAGDEHEH